MRVMIQSIEETAGQNGRQVLAVVSQYADKYFLNEELGKLPEEIRKEVLVLLIMVTDGEVYLASTCEEGDLGYDEISAGLLIREIEREHRDLLEQLSQWYRKVVRRRDGR